MIISRLYPFYSGNFSLINSEKIRRFTRDTGDAWCKGPGGPMLVPVGDAVGKSIYYTGDYDRKITWLCRRLLRPGDVAFDVGANLGVVALAMAKFVGPSGAVHAFEPNPTMQRYIESSVARCGYQNLTLHKVALGAEPAELDLFIPPNNFGAASFKKTEGTSIRCPVERLRDIADRESIQNFRLMKLDVEGFENQVLLGMLGLRPDAIIMETNEELEGPFRNRPAIATLLAHDYRIFAIPRALLRMRVIEADLDQHAAPSHDILAIKRELDYPAL